MFDVTVNVALKNARIRSQKRTRNSGRSTNFQFLCELCKKVLASWVLFFKLLYFKVRSACVSVFCLMYVSGRCFPRGRDFLLAAEKKLTGKALCQISYESMQTSERKFSFEDYIETETGVSLLCIRVGISEWMFCGLEILFLPLLHLVFCTLLDFHAQN